MNDSRADKKAIERRTSYQPGSAQEYFTVHRLREGIESALAEFANHHIGAGGSLLDVGCGEQPLRSAVEGMGWHYASADVQQNRAGSVDFIATIDQPLPQRLVESGPFDFILCTEVLEHVADWDCAFRNLALLLGPSGRVLVTCPHFYPLHEVPYDYWRPTPFALQFFGARHGLRILRQESLGDGLDVLGAAFACIRPEPRNSGVISGFMALVCDISRKAAFVLLRSRVLRRYVAAKSDLYLSNLVVFERSDNS